MAALRYLVVDGHSVLFHWPEWRQLHARNQSLARQLLIRMLGSLHDAGRWRVTLVFDGREGKVEHRRPEDLVVSYAGADQTADSIIEKLVGGVKTPDEIMVITADQAEGRLVESLGASWSSPEWLLSELEASGCDLGSRLEDISRKARW